MLTAFSQVVDSKGLREVLDTYRTAASEGLLAPSSQLLNANAISTPPDAISKHQIGITLAGNWFTLQWLKQVSAPYYPDAEKQIGFAPLPTISAGAPGAASTLSGWDLAVYANTKQKDLAWKFVEIMQRKDNLIEAGLLNGWTPPVTAYAQDKAWTELDPFQGDFQKILPIAVGIPVKPTYNTWAMGLLTATEALVLDPKMPVDAAMKKMGDYVANQAGSDEVEAKK